MPSRVNAYIGASGSSAEPDITAIGTVISAAARQRRSDATQSARVNHTAPNAVGSIQSSIAVRSAVIGDALRLPVACSTAARNHAMPSGLESTSNARSVVPCQLISTSWGAHGFLVAPPLSTRKLASS
jgi:hypothetical protein